MAGLTRMTGPWNPGEDAYDESNPSSYSEHRDAAIVRCRGGCARRNDLGQFWDTDVSPALQARIPESS